MILFDPNIDFDTCKVYTNFKCICDYCGKEFIRSKRNLQSGHKVIQKDSCGDKNCVKLKREESSLLLHGVKNAGATSEALKKAKQTNIEKFGVENAAQSELVKEKIKRTCLEKYDKTSYLATDEARKKCKEYHQIHNDKIRQKIVHTNLDKYGHNCPLQSDICKEKSKQTCKEKYGVEHIGSCIEAQEKKKKTMQERYNCEYPLQYPKFLEKSQQTNLDRYQETSYTKTDECKNKKKKTNVEKYGADHPQKNLEVKNKTKNTQTEKYGNYYIATKECQENTKKLYLKKYGKEYYVQTEECKEKSKSTQIEKYGDLYSKSQEFKEKYKKTCLEKYNVPCTLNLIKKYDKTEKEITEWLKTVSNLDFKKNYSILDGKEIDLFNEEAKLGIEYCGIYWHNEFSRTPRDKNYHYEKYKKCDKLGIKLLTIFDDEWIFKKEQCQSIIKSSLGIFDLKVYARNCSVKEIDVAIFKNFCDNHHLQGSSRRNQQCFGLYHKDELVGALSLGKHHRKNSSQEIVLSRLCFKMNYQIIGGASKLLKHALNWSKLHGYSKLISWSDNRWSNGNVYLKLGFTLEEELKPDYSYVDMKSPKQRLSKQSQKKHCPENKTESEKAAENGLARIWDCGKKRWVIFLDRMS